MDNTNSGLYTLNEFKERSILKLAPDAFVTFMGRSEIKVAVKINKTENIDIKGGITSINISGGVEPGTGTCSMTVVCPQYESLNQSYYITQPSGVKIPFFESMMEFRVYGKGRFLDKDSKPIYYPVFWGFIASINESTAGSETSFNLTCKDMLGLWEYQTVNVVPSSVYQKLGGAGSIGVGVYRNMSSWEVILNLFREAGMENMIYPSLVADKINTEWVTKDLIAATYEKMSGAALAYIHDLGVGKSNTDGKNDYVSNLEMFGVSGIDRLDIASTFVPVKAEAMQAMEDERNDIKAETDENLLRERHQAGNPGNDMILVTKKSYSDFRPVCLDFDILGAAQPFLNYDNMKVGTEATRWTKLETASFAANAVGFEFFLDLCGTFVFKPPFYNMDVTHNHYYNIEAKDIISLDMSEDSTQIVTYIEASCPVQKYTNSTPWGNFHIDFSLLARFGVRERTITLLMGKTQAEARALACSEMAKSNANAFTANLVIPFRPELRLGYPVYIDHLDCFYYIKGISHSITFGGNATTTLTLSAKRTRVYDGYGNLLQGYIYQSTIENNIQKNGESDEDYKKRIGEIAKNILGGFKTDLQKQNLERLKDNKDSSSSSSESPLINTWSSPRNAIIEAASNRNLISSPNPGFYKAVQLEAFKTINTTSSDAVSRATTATSAISSNTDLSKLSRFTDSTHPYTDVNGFQHIGGFPFGSSMVLAPVESKETYIDSNTFYSGEYLASNSSTLIPDAATSTESIATDNINQSAPSLTTSDATGLSTSSYVTAGVSSNSIPENPASTTSDSTNDKLASSTAGLTP